MSVCVQPTKRFTTFTIATEPYQSTPSRPVCPTIIPSNKTTTTTLPVIDLYDILEAHGSIRRRCRHINHHEKEQPNELLSRTVVVGQLLYDAIVQHGFVLIKVPKGRATTTIRDLRTSLHNDFFPIISESVDNNDDNANTNKTNTGGLVSSSTIYVSERGVPMYKLGYELCDDHVREVFRIAASNASESVIWPTSSSSLSSTSTSTSTTGRPSTTKSIWMRGLGLLRHVADATLDLLLLVAASQHSNSEISSSSPPPPPTTTMLRIPNRPHSGATTWWDVSDDAATTQKDRKGDFSVLYAMHYFNNGHTVEANVTVKEHVDPSLIVIEPFLNTKTSGLQVWDRTRSSTYPPDTTTSTTDRCSDSFWIDCDGPNSPICPLVIDAQRNNEELMLVFVGKALTAAIPNCPPTVHRVVTGIEPRHTIIYEQKYSEFYPPPSFD